MPTRLEQLHAMLDKEPNDAFLLYGIALEHKKAGELEQALAYLERTIAVQSTHAYAYYQKGQVLEAQDQRDAARYAYKEGILAAKTVDDAHAQSELIAAMDALDE